MDHQTAVSDSREALEVTLRFGSRHLGPAIWEPTAPSEATEELANAETGANGVPWGENPSRTAYAAANLMMTGVLDILGGLSQLLDDKMSVIGPTILARSAIETAAGAFWLMEPDGSGLLHWNLPPEVLDSTVQLAIAAFRETYRHIQTVMGWGKLEPDLWELKLSKIYGR